MIFSINGSTVENIIARSVKIHKRSNYQHDVKFNFKLDLIDPEFGQELIITDGANTVFGGLIQQPEKLPKTKNFVIANVISTGYKQLLARRSFEAEIINEKAGVAVERLFDGYLATGSTTSEELTKGTIEEGELIESYIDQVSGYKLFSDLAQQSGLRVWIDDLKTFYFASKPTYTTITKAVTDDVLILDRFRLIEAPKLIEDPSNYRTRQYVVGANKDDGSLLIGLAVNAAEETRMKSNFGSGVHGDIIRNNNVSTQDQADNAAAAELAANSKRPIKLSLKTIDYIDINQVVPVDLAMYGINDNYIVDEVIIKFDQTVNMIVYEAILKNHETTAKQENSWTDDWNDALKNTKQEKGATASGGSGGNTQLYVQPQEPYNAPDNTAWIDTNDYSHYDTIKDPIVMLVEDGEVVFTAIPITLFSAAQLDDDGNLYSGILIKIKNTSAAAIQITPYGIERIDGALGAYTLAALASLELVSDGVDWWIM